MKISNETCANIKIDIFKEDAPNFFAFYPMQNNIACTLQIESGDKDRVVVRAEMSNYQVKNLIECLKRHLPSEEVE